MLLYFKLCKNSVKPQVFHPHITTYAFFCKNIVKLTFSFQITLSIDFTKKFSRESEITEISSHKYYFGKNFVKAALLKKKLPEELISRKLVFFLYSAKFSRLISKNQLFVYNFIQVGFHKEKEVRKIKVSKRDNMIVNRLNKTKREEKPDFRTEREKRDISEREEKKKVFKQLEEEKKKEEKKRKEEAEHWSYDRVMNNTEMTSNKDGGNDSDDFM